MTIGCPYKSRNIGTYDTEYCPIIKKSVAEFVMCEADWESCPEYLAMKKLEAEEYLAYEKENELNGVNDEFDILVLASEIFKKCF